MPKRVNQLDKVSCQLYLEFLRKNLFSTSYRYCKNVLNSGKLFNNVVNSFDEDGKYLRIP